MDKKAGTYYGCVPWIVEELIQAKKVKIETSDKRLYVYDCTGKVPRLIFYSSNIEYK